MTTLDEKKPVTPLTPSMRSQVISLMKTKESNVVKALETEVSGDPRAIMTKLLKDKGFNVGYDDLRSEKSELEDLKDQAGLGDDQEILNLNEQRDELDSKIEAEKELVQDEIRSKIELLRTEQKRRIVGIESSQETRETEIRARIEEREAVLMSRIQPGVLDRLSEIEILLPKILRVQRDLSSEANRISKSITASRGRLISLVHDAAVRAQMELLSCTTSDQAYLKLDIIPTVAEVIHISEDPEAGLIGLIDRLAPSFSVKMISGPVSDETEVDAEEIEGSESIFNHSPLTIRMASEEE